MSPKNVLLIDSRENMHSAIQNSLEASDHHIDESVPHFFGAIRLLNDNGLKEVDAVILSDHLGSVVEQSDFPCSHSMTIIKKIGEILADQESTDPIFVLTPLPKFEYVKVKIRGRNTSERHEIDMENDNNIVLIDFDASNVEDMEHLPEILDNL